MELNANECFDGVIFWLLKMYNLATSHRNGVGIGIWKEELKKNTTNILITMRCENLLGIEEWNKSNIKSNINWVIWPKLQNQKEYDSTGIPRTDRECISRDLQHGKILVGRQKTYLVLKS